MANHTGCALTNHPKIGTNTVKAEGRGMDRLRLAPLEDADARTCCCRCGAGEQRWDRIAGRSYCPNCQEELAMGVAAPLKEATEPGRCLVCARRGTVRFQTVPLHAASALELDLCGEHLRGLLGRRLGPYAYQQIKRMLRTMDVQPDSIFLLHNEFYDVHGRALRPAMDAE